MVMALVVFAPKSAVGASAAKVDASPTASAPAPRAPVTNKLPAFSVVAPL